MGKMTNGLFSWHRNNYWTTRTVSPKMLLFWQLCDIVILNDKGKKTFHLTLSKRLCSFWILASQCHIPVLWCDVCITYIEYARHDLHGAHSELYSSPSLYSYIRNFVVLRWLYEVYYVNNCLPSLPGLECGIWGNILSATCSSNSGFFFLLLCLLCFKTLSHTNTRYSNNVLAVV